MGETGEICSSFETNRFPVVKQSGLPLSEGYYRRGDNSWAVPRLIAFAKEKGYKKFKLPVAGIDLTCAPWDIKDLDDFIHHAARCNKADTSFPILLDEKGGICDGYHRLAKAILNKDEYIYAIRLESMPTPE